MLGVDGPFPHESCGTEAQAFLEDLIDSQMVRLDLDVTPSDQFGQLLRYVFLTDGTFVNAVMVEQGWVEAVDIPPDSRYATVLAELETEAKVAHRGMWGPNCSPATG
jgi:micrococcal nuclease